MSENRQYSRIQHLRGKQTDWTARVQKNGGAESTVGEEVIPLAGELVIETDDSGYNRLKIGNGATTYKELPYLDDKVLRFNDATQCETITLEEQQILRRTLGITSSGEVASNYNDLQNIPILNKYNKKNEYLHSWTSNDIVNNKVYSNYAVALGTNTTAGSNAFKIIAVDTENLSMTLNSINGLTTGLECSCQYDKNFDLFGTITAIDTENNIVTFSVLPSDVFTEGQKNVLWVPSNPELGDGDTFVGTEAFATGDNNKSSQVGSFTAGGNNIAAGKYSAVFGENNKAGYCSAVFGQYNKGHQWSLVGGYKNTVTAPFAFAAGGNNTVSAQYGNALGHSNTVDGEASFVAGNSSKVNSINSFSSGTGNLIDTNAKESFAAGSNNKIYAPHSVTIGFNNEIAKSTYGRSFASGSENLINHNYAAAIGKQLTTGKDNQVVVGRQNVVDENAVFIVANGTAATGTSNAFTVKSDGSAEVKTQGITDNSVATKGYVDNQINDNVDQFYRPTSTKSQSGIAVDQALQNTAWSYVYPVGSVYCSDSKKKEYTEFISSNYFDKTITFADGSSVGYVDRWYVGFIMYNNQKFNLDNGYSIQCIGYTDGSSLKYDYIPLIPIQQQSSNILSQNDESANQFTPINSKRTNLKSDFLFKKGQSYLIRFECKTKEKPVNDDITSLICGFMTFNNTYVSLSEFNVEHWLDYYDDNAYTCSAKITPSQDFFICTQVIYSSANTQRYYDYQPIITIIEPSTIGGWVYQYETGNDSDFLINPSKLFGGKWELIDKGFDYDLSGAGTSLFQPASDNITFDNYGGVATVYDGRTVRLRITLTIKQQMTQNNLVLGKLDFSKIGITDIPYGFMDMVVSDSDPNKEVASSGIVWELQHTGQLVQTGIIGTPSSSSTFSFDIVFVASPGSMLDPCCDKFYWKRIG